VICGPQVVGQFAKVLHKEFLLKLFEHFTPQAFILGVTDHTSNWLKTRDFFHFSREFLAIVMF
jgi:hypothetical protein